MNGTVSPALVRLEHLGLIRFTGPDAIAFLQGQLSNDTRRLAKGEPLFASYSTPQGRVLALLYLLPHAGSILGILPRELIDPTLERLRKFVLRAKVKIDAPGEALSFFGVVDPQALHALGFVPPTPNQYVEHGHLGTACVGPDATRFWLVGAPAALQDVGAAARVDALDGWRLQDIRAGLPQVFAATSESFVAQMLNLDLLDGISFSKGCYTGQEIIARTQHLGRIKRRMHRLKMPPGQWQIGQAVRLADGRLGRLIEVVPLEDGSEALAVLTLDAAVETPEAAAGAAINAVQLPLPYSLTN